MARFINQWSMEYRNERMQQVERFLVKVIWGFRFRCPCLRPSRRINDLDRITDFISREKGTKKLTSRKVWKDKKYHGMKIIYSQVKILVYINIRYATFLKFLLFQVSRGNLKRFNCNNKEMININFNVHIKIKIPIMILLI